MLLYRKVSVNSILEDFLGKFYSSKFGVGTLASRTTQLVIRVTAMGYVASHTCLSLRLYKL